jgi:UDP-3-O-[3-hydroxymyristoyl] glucosamine N-acyltransferase
VSPTLHELARAVAGEVRGDAARQLTGIATLAAATPEQLSFLTNPRYRAEAEGSRAGALLVGPGVEFAERNLLVAEDPYFALAQLLELYHPVERPAAGVDARAVVGPGCDIHPSATVGALAVIGPGSVVGEGVVVASHAVVGSGCRIGARTVLHPHAVLYAGTELGADCVVHAGAVLGSDGFGYATREGVHVKVPQVGRVVVEDGVEIGANTTVDRAMLDETRLGAGSKIDNLVQVGHNVRLGKGCIVVAQAGIAGSTRLGAYVVVAGQAGVAGHLTLGDGARVAAKSAVFQDVEAGQQVAGIPAGPAASWRRQQARLRQLEEMHQRLLRLERRSGAVPGEGER